MVLGVVIYWVLFVLVMVVTYWARGGVPDTLIQYALGGGAVELVITALIELVKPVVERQVAKEEEQEDEDLLLLDWEDIDDGGCDSESD